MGISKEGRFHTETFIFCFIFLQYFLPAYSYIFSVPAIKLDNCTNVKGFSVWTLADNFEFLEGYTQKYGLFHIDRNDPELKRIPKASSVLYTQVGHFKC